MAIKSGAKQSSISITEKEYSTLSYIPGQAIQIKITAVGEVDDWKEDAKLEAWNPKHLKDTAEVKASKTQLKQSTTATGNKIDCDVDEDEETKLNPQEPFVDPSTGEWILSPWDIECIVIGAGIFGCGGGGSPNIGRLRCLKALREGKTMKVVSPERLFKNANPDTDKVVCVAFMGAPLIIYEQLISSEEIKASLQGLTDLYNIGQYQNGQINNVSGTIVKEKAGMRFIENYHPGRSCTSLEASNIAGKNIVALISCEIAGLNALEPLIVSADLGIPTIDADGMGRAFPELQMFIPFVYGVDPYPSVISNDKDRRAVMLKTPSAKQLEDHFRNTVVDMGCMGGLVLAPLSKQEVLEKTIHYSVSRAWRMGNAILRARMEKINVIESILKEENSRHLITGKIVDVQKETTAGFNKGYVVIEGLDNFVNTSLLVEYKNENLVVFQLDKDCKTISGEILACVPDLIMVVDADTAHPITTEEMKYGMRIALIVLASHPMLRTEQALRFVGPQAFRYPETVQFKPFAEAKTTIPIPLI